MTLLKLVIHNAPFDVGFINHEIALLAKSQAVKIDNIDMLEKKTPGQVVWRKQG